MYASTRKEVAVRLERLRQSHREGTLSDADARLTLHGYLDQWLTGIRHTVKPATWRAYEEKVRLYIVPALGKRRLADVTPLQVQNLYSDLLSRLSPQSVVHVHRVLHTALAQAVKWNMAPRNVAAAAQPPRVPRRPMECLTAEEVEQLLSAARGDRFEALYVLAVSTGARKGELLALRWRNVNLEAGTASVVGSLHRDLEGRLAIADTKTSTSRRTLALTPTAVTTLRQHRAVQAQQRIAMGPAWQDHDLVFSTGKGTAVAPTDLHRKSFRPLLERSGVRRIRFHDLRVRHEAPCIRVGCKDPPPGCRSSPVKLRAA